MANVQLDQPHAYPTVAEFEAHYELGTTDILVAKNFAVCTVVLATLRYQQNPAESLYQIVCKRLALERTLFGSTTARFRLGSMHIDLTGSEHEVEKADGDMIVDVGGRRHSLKEYQTRVQAAHDRSAARLGEEKAAVVPFLEVMDAQLQNLRSLDLDGLVAQELATLRDEEGPGSLQALTQLAYFDLLNAEIRRVTGTGPFQAAEGQAVVAKPDGSVAGVVFEGPRPDPNAGLTVESVVDRVRGPVVLVSDDGRAYHGTNETVLYL